MKIFDITEHFRIMSYISHYMYFELSKVSFLSFHFLFEEDYYVFAGCRVSDLEEEAG